MKKLFAVLILVFSMDCIAQYPTVGIPGSEVRKISSSIVAGQEYELHILLPGDYKNSTKKYPVVYLMDSQWDFPLVKSLYGQQYFDGFIPATIIVGVTWGGTNPNPDSLRARDYTPTKGRLPQSGGAPNFLSFMKKELFPFIEANYKADPSERVLMGCSFGGLFALYALFTEPGLFKGCVAASPAYGWDGEGIYKYEKMFFKQHRNTSARLYMTIGDVERNVGGYEKFAAHLNSRKYPSLQIRSKVLENTGHSGTKNETYARGLQFVFERPSLTLDSAQLNKYLGQYELNNVGRAEIKNENNKLVVYFGANKYVLRAASETDFYSTSEFLNIHFQNAQGRVEGLQLNRYGSSQFIKKIN